MRTGHARPAAKGTTPRPPIGRPLRLGSRSVMRLEDGAGLSVHCQGGDIWLTQENDRRDIVLAPGQSFRLDRQGRALLFALSEAWVCLLADGGAAARHAQSRRAEAQACA